MLPPRGLPTAHSAHNPKVAGSNPAPATMNDEGLAERTAANPLRLPRLHPGIGLRACATERTLMKLGRFSRGVTDVVRRQTDAGVDVITDGEQGKASFFGYIVDRFTGFERQPAPPGQD